MLLTGLFNEAKRKLSRNYLNELSHYRGADKSLARPGRKQATATKL